MLLVSYLSALRAEPATVPNLAAEHSYLYVFQASLSRSAANNNAKNEQFCSRLSSLCDVKIHPKGIKNQPKIRSGAVPGALRGDLGTILIPGWSKAQKWEQKAVQK